MTAFAPDQQEYLKGFMAGVEAKRRQLGLPLAPAAAAKGSDAGPASPERIAQDRAIAAGGKLGPEEQAKRKNPPLERWDAIARGAADGVFPKGTDVFLTKYEGLFYVAPAQFGFMCRLRIPGGIMSAFQMRALADIADECAGGYTTVTTRANLQLREIPAEKPIELLMRLNDIGIFPRGSGADNVRNITGSPTAGIDPDELIDTRPHARAIHHFLLRHPELTGLPRKFNIAFDGGGRIPVLEDTNDVAFTACRVADGHGVPPGIYYRLALGGITGHRDFAKPTGVIATPDEVNDICQGILRVFIASGSRTDRKRARLKYVLDDWGFDKFLAEVEAVIGRTLTRVDAAAMTHPVRQDRFGHIGVHAQKQDGLYYVGVVLPVGQIPSAAMRGLADIAERYGSGTIRLTVWQNLLISDIPAARLADAIAAIEALGFSTEAKGLRAGLIACTGSAACRFGNAETKTRGDTMVTWLEQRIAIDEPLNIHLTGCHNSCAQHYIAEIGLLGARVERGEDTVDGFDLHVGGGAGPDQAIGRLIAPAIPSDELPHRILGLLRAWHAGRAPDESFGAWSARHDDTTLAAHCAPVGEDAA